MVYNRQKTWWNHTLDHGYLAYYMIINIVKLGYFILPRWLLQCLTAWKTTDVGLVEKATDSHLHESCGVLLECLCCRIGDLPPSHRLCAFYVCWCHRYDCHQCLSYQVSRNENRMIDMETPWLRTWCVLWISPSTYSNYHSVHNDLSMISYYYVV